MRKIPGAWGLAPITEKTTFKHFTTKLNANTVFTSYAEPIQYYAYNLSLVGSEELWPDIDRPSPPQTLGEVTNREREMWVAIDMAMLTASPRPLHRIMDLKQVGSAGYGFKIYRVSPADHGIIGELRLLLKSF